MTVGELLERMTSRELSEWMAFDMIEPFGSGRTNLALGTVAMIQANSERDREKHSEPWPSEMFVPYFDKYEPGAEIEEAPSPRARPKTTLRSAAVAAGARLLAFLDRRI